MNKQVNKQMNNSKNVKTNSKQSLIGDVELYSYFEAIPKNMLFISLIGATIFFLGNVLFNYLIPLDLNSPQSLWSLTFGSYHLYLFSSALSYLFLGFLSIELLTYIFPYFKNLKKSGFRGRKQLNQFSLACSFIIMIFNAHMIYNSLQSVSGLFLFGFSSDSVVFRLLFYILCALVLGIVYALGKWTTKKGVCNGFILFLFVVILTQAVQKIDIIINNEVLSKSTAGGIFFINSILVLVLIFFFFAKKRSEEVTYKNEKIKYDFPALPQSATCIGDVFSALLLFTTLQTLFPDVEMFSKISPNIKLIFASIAFPFLAYVSYKFAYSPKSILRSMDGELLLNKQFTLRMKNYFLVSSVILFVLAMFYFFYDLMSFSISLTYTFVLVFILKDFYKDHMFFNKNFEISKAKAFTHIGSLDNVHLVKSIKGLLDNHNIPLHIRGGEYRFLFSVFDPLIKMDLYVNTKDKAKTQSLLQLSNVKQV